MSVWPSPSGVVNEFLRELQALDTGALSAGELLPMRMMLAWQRVLGVDGAGVSVLSRIRVPLGASNDFAASAERLQSTLGAGPCLDAYHQSTALVADEQQMQTRWPLFHGQLVEATPFRAVASVPLRAGEGRLGAVDMYWHAPHIADEAAVLAAAGELAVAVSEQLSAQPTGEHQVAGVPLQPWVGAPAARQRMQVWVAIGMLSVTRDLNSVDALATLRASAYARNITIDDLCAQLIERRIRADQLTD